MPTENKRFNDVQKWKESKSKMKSRNIQEHFNDIANGRDEETIGTIEFDPVNKDLKVVVDGHLEIPTLSPEYIAFVEWTQNAGLHNNHNWQFDDRTRVWFDRIDREEEDKTTRQLFNYFLENVYKK